MGLFKRKNKEVQSAPQINLPGIKLPTLQYNEASAIKKLDKLNRDSLETAQNKTMRYQTRATQDVSLEDMATRLGIDSNQLLEWNQGANQGFKQGDIINLNLTNDQGRALMKSVDELRAENERRAAERQEYANRDDVKQYGFMRGLTGKQVMNTFRTQNDFDNEEARVKHNTAVESDIIANDQRQAVRNRRDWGPMQFDDGTSELTSKQFVGDIQNAMNTAGEYGLKFAGAVGGAMALPSLIQAVGGQPIINGVTQIVSKYPILTELAKGYFRDKTVNYGLDFIGQNDPESWANNKNVRAVASLASYKTKLPQIAGYLATDNLMDTVGIDNDYVRLAVNLAGMQTGKALGNIASHGTSDILRTLENGTSNSTIRNTADKAASYLQQRTYGIDPFHGGKFRTSAFNTDLMHDAVEYVPSVIIAEGAHGVSDALKYAGIIDDNNQFFEMALGSMAGQRGIKQGVKQSELLADGASNVQEGIQRISKHLNDPKGNKQRYTGNYEVSDAAHAANKNGGSYASRSNIEGFTNAQFAEGMPKSTPYLNYTSRIYKGHNTKYDGSLESFQQQVAELTGRKTGFKGKQSAVAQLDNPTLENIKALYEHINNGGTVEYYDPTTGTRQTAWTPESGFTEGYVKSMRGIRSEDPILGRTPEGNLVKNNLDGQNKGELYLGDGKSMTIYSDFGGGATMGTHDAKSAGIAALLDSFHTNDIATTTVRPTQKDAFARSSVNQKGNTKYVDPMSTIFGTSKLVSSINGKNVQGLWKHINDFNNSKTNDYNRRKSLQEGAQQVFGIEFSPAGAKEGLSYSEMANKFGKGLTSTIKTATEVKEANSGFSLNPKRWYRHARSSRILKDAQNQRQTLIRQIESAPLSGKQRISAYKGWLGEIL